VPIPRPLDEGGAPLGAVAIMTDVTALQQNARRLEAALAQLQAQVVEITLLREIAERSALLDPLTGLGNRRSLSQAFEALGNAPVAVALIDIDHFKQINDRLGHGVGDRVLRAFSDAVRSVLPEGCSVYRVGGEEFFALCPGITQSSMLAILGRLAQRVVDDPPLREHDHPRVTFSGGVAVRPGDGETFDQLYARADARLYEAKRGGRNRVMHLDGMPFDTPVSPGGPGGKGRASHG
jgi:diguanylate cyclase (GGDEF)-like protein